ncbi:MAG: hypothetical protein ABIP55_16150, partial [Tepidisphaeraceae bacterium]
SRFSITGIQAVSSGRAPGILVDFDDIERNNTAISPDAATPCRATAPVGKKADDLGDILPPSRRPPSITIGQRNP